VAIILSRSRAGWLFMVTGVLTIFMLSKKPITTLVVVGIIASITILFPILSKIMAQRVEQAGTFGAWGESVVWRFIIWKKMLTNISIGSIIVGVGRIGSFARYHFTSHNYYVSVLVETGIAGIFYFILLGISLWRRTWANIRHTQDFTMLALWKGIFAVNVGVLFYSIPVETLDVDLVAKALFFFWSLLYLRDYLTTENYPSESYDDISYEQQESPELREVYEY
jgi:O-antigen ligase